MCDQVVDVCAAMVVCGLVAVPLEELEEVFNSPYPPRANVKKRVAVKEDGHVDVI